MTENRPRPRYKIPVPPGSAPAATPKVARRSARLWVGPVWGLSGFVLGVAVWHALGFWDFVGKTVLKGDEDERRMARIEAPAGAPAMRTTASVHGPKQIVAGYSVAATKAMRACSSIAPGQDGEAVAITACPAGTATGPATRLARKADFGAVETPSTTSWTIITTRAP